MALMGSLHNFHEFLLSIDHPAIAMLNGEMDQQNMDVLFLSKDIDLKGNDDLYTLYGWGNGIQMSREMALGQMWFFEQGIFLSFEMAVETYQIFVHQEELWNKKLFPLFTSGGGDFLLIDLEPTSPTYNMIHLYAPTVLLGFESKTIYDSLDHLFITALACYEQGEYCIKDGLFHANEGASLICAKLNPLSEFWKD
ncbi:hypothetical protein GFS24_03640 [Chitinophaga sp. SYP-B3965]|uniref:SMI1/KNR4 family protein n=1 Tax=Chitinophaga sp. SYP-B3965 TaxID=2663120 RepID=UPI00129A0079|nr:SMI1/KNR4 family protein [Chitinophaga sp. SYP-B3965]MRG44189.1 hypothetical protein [Chitinophaga sp. SYP-B3965]